MITMMLHHLTINVQWAVDEWWCDHSGQTWSNDLLSQAPPPGCLAMPGLLRASDQCPAPAPSSSRSNQCGHRHDQNHDPIPGAKSSESLLNCWGPLGENMQRKWLGNTPIPHHREGIHRIDWVVSLSNNWSSSESKSGKKKHRGNMLKRTDENILQM